MDGSIEVGGVGEGVVGEIVRFEIVPDNLDVVEFGRVFRQPLNGQPMLARFEGGKGELADVDRSIVLDQHDRLHGSSRLGAVETVELLQMSDEVAAALGRAGVHDQLARDMIERADHRHFFGLSRRRHAQIGAALGPRPRQIRVRQGLALVVNIAPDLDGKVDIIQNAIDLAQAMGLTEVRVAILSAMETVTAKVPSTIEAAALCKMADRGQITGALLDGPLALDNAISPEAAAIKKIASPVAGRANVLVVPDLEAGNMLAKSLSFLAGAEAAGIVLGARVPIILTSRANSLVSRLASCAVAVMVAAARRKSAPAAIR